MAQCACRRSITELCDGRHALTEEQWAKVQDARAKDQFLNEEEFDDTHNTSDQGG